MPQKVPQSEAPEAPFLIEAPFLVIINSRLAAVKIYRKFHESNFEYVRKGPGVLGSQDLRISGSQGLRVSGSQGLRDGGF